MSGQPENRGEEQGKGGRGGERKQKQQQQPLPLKSPCDSIKLFSFSGLFFRFSQHLAMSQADNNGLWGTFKNQTIVLPGVK